MTAQTFDANYFVINLSEYYVSIIVSVFLQKERRTLYASNNFGGRHGKTPQRSH
jgi:hypothetical protein